MSDDFAAPGSTSQIDYNTLKGHLLLIQPVELEHDFPTSLGAKDAVRADVHDLTTNTSYTDTLIFPKVLVSSLRGRVGQKVLAHLSQGTAKPGQSAPWTLLDATGDAQAIASAKAFLSGNGASKPATPAPTEKQALQNLESVFGNMGDQPPF